MTDLNQIYQAYLQNGKNKAKAAAFLNIPKSTYKDRLERAMKFFGADIQPKILFFDLEISHLISAHYGLYNINVNKDDILHDWYMMSAAWKWRGEKDVHSVCLLDDPVRFAKNNFDIRHLKIDDYHVVKTIYEAIAEADILVYQNGDRFDLKKFQTRAAYHGFPRLEKKVTVDLYKIAKKHFLVTSNALDYLCKFFGVEGKMRTEKGLFLRAALCDEAAIRDLVKYNKRDIWPSLEGLFNVLLPYVETINMNLFTSEVSCKCCGSRNLIEHDKRIYTKTTVRALFRCGDCQSLTTVGKALRTVSAK